MSAEPFDDVRTYQADGELFPPSPHALAPRIVCERALGLLTPHVEEATRWSESSPQPDGVPSEYAFLLALQPVSARAWRIVSVWCEPGRPAIVRISGKAEDQPDPDLLAPAQRNRLLDCGFRLTRCKRYLRKDVSPELRPTGRDIAFLLVYLLSEVLGYDGRTPAYFAVSRARRRSSGHMLEALDHAGLGSLLRGRGLEVGPVEHDGHSGWLVRDRTPFLAVLEGPEADSPGQHRGFGLFAFIRAEPEVLRPVANELRETLRFATAQVHDGEKLLVRHHVRVEGGVSDAHLHRMLDLWRESLEKTGDVIQRHRNRLGLRSR